VAADSVTGGWEAAGEGVAAGLVGAVSAGDCVSTATGGRLVLVGCGVAVAKSPHAMELIIRMMISV